MNTLRTILAGILNMTPARPTGLSSRKISLTPPFMGVLMRPYGRVTVSTVFLRLQTCTTCWETAKAVTRPTNGITTPINGGVNESAGHSVRRGTALLLSATAVLAASTLCTFGGQSQAPVTLVRPDSPTKAPSADGYIQRWVVLEPIPAQGVTQSAIQAAVKKEYFPNQFTVIPKDGDKVTVTNVGGAGGGMRGGGPGAAAGGTGGGNSEFTWHALDTKDYNFNLYHYSHDLNKPSNNVLWWVVTVVVCPEEMRDVRLAIGSNDASVWWLNGQEIIGLYGDRQNTFDDAVSKRLTLKKGANVIRAAVHNQQGATDFCARFLDAEDKPIKNITIDLSAAGQ
jgi:hypothetical protein